MSGHWPPEWEDSEEELSQEAEQLDATVLAGAAEARLSEVAAFLAAAPMPAMPEAVEARISAALATEAADFRPLGPAPKRARVRLHRGGDRRRRYGEFLRRPATGIGALVVCLVVALGLVISRGSTPTYSSASSAGTAQGPNYGSASSSAASSAAGSSSSGFLGAAPAPAASAYAGPASFVVTASGTRYQRATLAQQVRARSTPATSAGTAPGATLRGCVLAVTDGALPRLVDRATYQGEPAYVIASSTRVWVVGLGCTATKTELVVSVALAGLPGNLRALVSVEQ